MADRTKQPATLTPATRYEDDLYTWVQEQLVLLRAGRASEIDLANIAEELSDVGNEQRDKLESAIMVLSLHLLKWDHQTERRSRSWQSSILEQRDRIVSLLERNPGLKGRLRQSIEVGYRRGRFRAAGETNVHLSIFPTECPYAWDEMLSRAVDLDGDSR